MTFHGAANIFRIAQGPVLEVMDRGIEGVTKNSTTFWLVRPLGMNSFFIYFHFTFPHGFEEIYSG